MSIASSLKLSLLSQRVHGQRERERHADRQPFHHRSPTQLAIHQSSPTIAVQPACDTDRSFHLFSPSVPNLPRREAESCVASARPATTVEPVSCRQRLPHGLSCRADNSPVRFRPVSAPQLSSRLSLICHALHCHLHYRRSLALIDGCRSGEDCQRTCVASESNVYGTLKLTRPTCQHARFVCGPAPQHAAPVHSRF